MHSCVWKVRRKTSFLQSETSCLSQEAHRKQPAMQQPQLQLESRFEFSCFSSSEVKALVWPLPLQGPLFLQRGAWLAPKVMRKLWSDCLWMANLTADSLSPSLGTTGWLSSSAYAHRPLCNHWPLFLAQWPAGFQSLLSFCPWVLFLILSR